MRQPVRSFAIGLFTAGIIMLIGIYYFDSSEKEQENLTVEEMVPLLKEEGYRIVTEEDYIAVSVSKDNAKQKSDSEENSDSDKDKKEDTDKDKTDTKKKDDKEKDKSKDDKDKKDKNSDPKENDKVKTYTVHIEDGVLSSTISNSLEANDIIDNATKFNLYLTDNGYGEKIQLGKFKVNSDMSYKEIAEAITR